MDESYTRKLYNNPNFSDVIIQFGSRQVSAHKAILCTRSEYFNKLCGVDSQFAEKNEKIIELKDDHPNAVDAVLKYIYSHPYPKYGPGNNDHRKWQTHIEVAQAADKYLLPDLSKQAMTNAKRCLTANGFLIGAGFIMSVLQELPKYYVFAPELEPLAKKIRDQKIHLLLDHAPFRSMISGNETVMFEIIDLLRGMLVTKEGEAERLSGDRPPKRKSTTHGFV